jgi:hypothetical protein
LCCDFCYPAVVLLASPVVSLTSSFGNSTGLLFCFKQHFSWSDADGVINLCISDYMIRCFSILAILFFLSCNPKENKSAQEQTTKADTVKNNTVNYDTLPNGIRLLDNSDSSMHVYYREVVGSDTLTGGYITCYGIDDNSKYFYLRHDDTLHLLNKISKEATTWALGVLEKDFPAFFITAVDHGNNVPETYQVFEKSTAKNLLGNSKEAWNYKYLDDTLFFLYDNHTLTITGNYAERKDADSIFLYNIKSGSREGFKLPEASPDDIIYYDIKRLTNHSLTISSRKEFTNEEKLVKYSR